MPSHGAFESVPAQLGSSTGWEERIIVGACPLLEPDLQNLESLPSQRGAALLAPLALTTNVGSGARHDIAAAQVDQLGCSQSGLKGNDKDCMVATPDPGGAIGCCQQRIHLRAV